MDLDTSLNIALIAGMIALDSISDGKSMHNYCNTIVEP
jgi:hypothetical protein